MASEAGIPLLIVGLAIGLWCGNVSCNDTEWMVQSGVVSSLRYLWCVSLLLALQQLLRFVAGVGVIMKCMAAMPVGNTYISPG